MREVVGGLVEQHVAQATAQDHAEHAPEQHVVDVLGLHAAPALARAPLAQRKERDETQDVHEAVPAHGQRPEGEDDGVELRMGEQGTKKMRGRSPALSGNPAPYTQGRMSFPSPPELLGGTIVRRLDRPMAIPATPVMAKSTLIIVFIGNTPKSWPSGFRSGTRPARPSASRATPITIETAFMGRLLGICRGS